MRILVVEDEKRIADFLSRGLESAGHAVDVANDGTRAVELVHAAEYDLVILDLGLPDMDGLSVLQKIRNRKVSPPVLILSARGAVDDKVKGFQRGADDYLGKPFALEELIARLQALLRRPGVLLGAALRLGRLTFDTAAREITIDGKLELVPPREAAVLEVLLRRSGRVVPKQVIEDQLYGLSEEVSSNAVEVYVHRLRRQLSEANAGVEIHTIRGVGYLIRETP